MIKLALNIFKDKTLTIWFLKVGRIKESDINAMFDKIKSIVEIILWIQRVTIDRAPVNNDVWLDS